MNNILLKFIVEENSTFLNAIQKILLNNSREVLVVSGSKVKGTLSEGDILKAIINGSQINSEIKSHYNRNFKYLEKNDEEVALRYFIKYNFNLIPVVNKNFEIKDLIVFRELLKKQ